MRPDAEQMADRVAELGPVERVEMEVADAAGIKLAAEFGGDGRGDQLARGGQVVEPFEQIVEPVGNRGAAVCREAARRGDVGDRQDARARSRCRCPAAATASRKRKKQSAEKKNWVIARSAPASTLRFRLSRSNARDRGIRMAFGIGGDRNVERRDRLQAGDQLGRIGDSRPGCGCVLRARLGRIAAQRDDVAHAERPNKRARSRRPRRASRRRRSDARPA